MNQDLNLLPDVAKFQVEKMRYKRVGERVAIGIGAGWLVVMVIAFSGWGLSRFALAKAEKERNKATAEFRSVAGNLVMNQQLRYRAKLAGQILQNRFEYGLAFERIISLFDQEVVISKFEMSQGERFGLSGKVGSYAGMDKVENKVAEINQGKSDYFKSATLESLRLSRSEWGFDLEVYLK